MNLQPPDPPEYGNCLTCKSSIHESEVRGNRCIECEAPMSDMIEVQTTELTGPALEWAVATAEGHQPLLMPMSRVDYSVGVTEVDAEGKVKGFACRYSTDWSQGGPLIQAHAITLAPYSMDMGGQPHYWVAEPWGECPLPIDGDTPLIAACRALVAVKLGETVKVPAVLVKP